MLLYSMLFIEDIVLTTVLIVSRYNLSRQI
jgi:hypothetical protein